MNIDSLGKVVRKFWSGVSVSQEPPRLVGSHPGHPHHPPNMPHRSDDNAPRGSVPRVLGQRKCLSRKGLGVSGVVNILGLIGPWALSTSSGPRHLDTTTYSG